MEVVEAKLHDCGCFEYGDIFWTCCACRGETPEMRSRDAQTHAWEGAAMNGWNG